MTSYLLKLTLCFLIAGTVSVSADNNSETQEEPAVTRLREYLRLKAVHPDPDYNSSIAWIKNQANEIGLEYNIKEFDSPGSFAIWLTWKGTNQNLPSILLNSHIDVVPVDEAKWTHDPFGAEKDEQGNIYARGAQDMKSTAVQYLEAIRTLKSQGVQPLRNVFISFVPDEEKGGAKGMQKLVVSEEFKLFNVGFALDEGLPGNDNTLRVTWTERAIFQVEFIANGKSGHGSILHENTAAEKIQKVINSMFELRTTEKNRLERGNITLGDVTTINLTIMKGGTQVNVVPTQLTVVFDIRITPHWNLTYVENFLEDVRISAGPDVTLKYTAKTERFLETRLSSDNIWWNVFQATAKSLGFQLMPAIHYGGTDARFLRELGIPAFGFTTFTNTPILMHDNDEFINEGRFLEGINIYEQFLPKFFNLESESTDKLDSVPNQELSMNYQELSSLSNQRKDSKMVKGQRPRDLLQAFKLRYDDN